MTSTQRFEEFVPLPISNLIEEQFPGWYQEQGPRFVAFVKAYYEWMELEGKTLYYTRNYYNIKDIDNTLDEFIIYFKEKYLKNIQLTTKTDTRMLVKHALDIYRSKGTPRCVKLLFHLVYGEDVDLYYPSTDLFKLSDGVWYKPTYLELMLSDKNPNLVHKEVKGVNSKAVAYIDSVVRRSTKGRLQDVAYISAINGQFITGEKIQPTDLSIPLDDCPYVTGSLTAVELPSVGSGRGYTNGDIVDITSAYGEKAIGRVTETIDQFGQIEVKLTDGGYGYNSNATIYIANVMLAISNVNVVNPQRLEYFSFLDTVSQPQVWLNYYDATSPFTLGEEVFTYYGNGDVMGSGIILDKAQISATNGAILVGVYSGDLANTVYTTANGTSATLQISNGFSWANATGLFIANGTNISLTVNNVVGTFVVGETLRQEYGRGTIKSITENVIVIENPVRTIRPNESVKGMFSQATADVIDVAYEIGLCNTQNVFYSFNGNQLISNNITGTIDRIEQGSGLELTVVNNYSYSETISVPTDLIADYLDVDLNATSYGFPANASANLTTTNVGYCFTNTTITIGKATDVIVSNTGADYSLEPFIVVDNKDISALDYRNVILWVDGTNFGVGDFLQQTATGARGIVLMSNSTAVVLENMRADPAKQFMVSNSTSNTVVYSNRGLTANVVALDYNNTIMGRNMTFDTGLSVGNGAILTLDVIDSGFGFIEQETIYMGNNNGTATTVVRNQGKGTGYYKVKGGFLSDRKKLFDGWYWQNYSYEVQSSLMLSKYQKLLNQITHIAGTIMFGKIKYKTQDNSSLSSENAIITIS